MNKILLTGATGFIGKALLEFLTLQGNQVVPLRLREEITIDLNGFDAVIHLAGEPLTPGRWSAEKRAKILSSRVEGTAKLARALTKAQVPPKLFLCASAIGFYGDRQEERLTEASSPGSNFLAHVCADWEFATSPLQQRGTRIVHARFSMVLANDGGALKQLLLPTKLGLGATLGSGEQWVSFIAREDLLEAIDFILKTDALTGPINLSSPNPVRQKKFIATLAAVLHRRAFLKLPRWLVRLVFGQMGEEMLLASARVIPEKLLAAGFAFTFPDLKQALQHCLKNQ